MYISEWGPYLGYFPYVIEFSQSLILSNYIPVFLLLVDLGK